jgi:cell division protein FtsQ
VKRVEVKGIDRMERLTVYAIALDQHSRAMPLVNLEKVRGQLLQYGWIEDARVSRRLPDTLVVDIVERKPAAIWQYEQKLSLIDAQGVILEKVNVNAMPDLPLVIGKKANERAGELNALMDNVPSLKPVLAGATWVGNRRWDLRFQSGETLALPEGQDIAAHALIAFARMDGVQRLLGRGFARFDMRDPSKMAVRVLRPPETVDEAAKPADAI